MSENDMTTNYDNLTDEALSAEVATKVIGIQHGHLDTYCAPGTFVTCPVCKAKYATDISAAFLMEERIAELGLIPAYVSALSRQFDADDLDQQMWGLVHASPHQRCLAALSAVEGVTP